MFFVALRGVGIALRYETIPGIKHPTFRIDPKAFRDCFSAAACHFAQLQVDRLAAELAFGFGRRRGKRRFRRDIGPYRLDDRLEDWDSDAAPGRTAAESAAFAAGVVVAEPDRDGYVIGEAHEPGVVFLVRGAGLARDIGRKAGDRMRGAARQHALHHGLELVERRAVYGSDRARPRLLVTIDRFSVAIDGVHRMWYQPQAFIRDRSIERRKIERPHRLGAEHERIVPHAFAVDLRLDREVAQAVEAGFRLFFDAAVEQMYGGEIA